MVTRVSSNGLTMQKGGGTGKGMGPQGSAMNGASEVEGR